MIIESRAKLLCCCCIFIISVSDSVMLNAEECLYVPRFLLLYDSVVDLVLCTLLQFFKSSSFKSVSVIHSAVACTSCSAVSAFISSLLVCFIIDNSI